MKQEAVSLWCEETEDTETFEDEDLVQHRLSEVQVQTQTTKRPVQTQTTERPAQTLTRERPGLTQTTERPGLTQTTERSVQTQTTERPANTQTTERSVQTQTPVQSPVQFSDCCEVPEVPGPREVAAAWDPCIVGHRAVLRLLMLERRYLPSVLYTSLIQGAPESRDQLVRWAMEVCSDSGCEEQVFPLSVSLLDRFLSSSLSTPVSPVCLSAACVLIASKLSECETLSVDTLCAAAEYSFSSCSLREMERVVVATLHWDLASITPQDFLPHFLSAAVTSSSWASDSVVRRHADTLSALCVSDSRFLGAPPSLLAAGALCCALRGLGALNQEVTTEKMAHLCQTDPAVLQCYCEIIEFVLRERLQSAPSGKEEELTSDPEQRPGTPSDMTQVHL